jgi:hypothetical protein
VRLAGREFTHGCDLRLLELAPFGRGVELAPLIPELSSFPNKRGWAMRRRRPLLTQSSRISWCNGSSGCCRSTFSGMGSCSWGIPPTTALRNGVDRSFSRSARRLISSNGCSTSISWPRSLSTASSPSWTGYCTSRTRISTSATRSGSSRSPPARPRTRPTRSRLRSAASSRHPPKHAGVPAERPTVRSSPPQRP